MNPDHISRSRRSFLAMSTAFTAASTAGISQAQSAWPSSPIKIVAPVTAGGILDVVARLVASELSKKLSAEIVVENRPGANLAIGISAVGRSDPDGYRWLMSSVTMTTNAVLTRVPYDPIKDFQPTAMIGRIANVAVVPKQLGIISLKQFIALVKSDADKVQYANAAIGSLVHINTELLSFEAGFRIKAVPYQGQAGALSDLLANRVQFTMATPAVVQAFIQSGELVPLAVAARERSRLLPNVPTFAELGYPSVVFDSWTGILMPAGVPADIVRRVNAATNELLRDQNFLHRLEGIGVTPEQGPNRPEDFRTIIEAEMKDWPHTFKTIGIM